MSKLTNAGGDLFKNIPEELAEFVKYSEKLKFEEDPDYNYMKGFFQKILNRLNYNINNINFCWINKTDKNIKSSSRRKSSRRKRILENLDNIRIQRLELNTIQGNKNFENISSKNDNRFFSHKFENLTYNLNNNKTNILTENKGSNEGYNVTKTENNNNTNNKNNYITDKKNNATQYQIENLKYKEKKKCKINTALTKSSNYIYNHLSNYKDIKKNKIETRKNINPYKNIYIDKTKNNLINFGNPRNKIANNEMFYKKINSRMIFNNNLIKNEHTRRMTDFNINNEIKYLSNANKNSNNILNNKNYRHIKYASINSRELLNSNLYKPYNNALKVYKSRLKREENDYMTII